jgi:hypothetical protein
MTETEYKIKINLGEDSNLGTATDPGTKDLAEGFSQEHQEDTRLECLWGTTGQEQLVDTNLEQLEDTSQELLLDIGLEQQVDTNRIRHNTLDSQLGNNIADLD